MSMFEDLEAYGHEQLLFCSEPTLGLRAIIAIHDTSLGPALGGCRVYPYANEEEAVKDVLRLSRGMTYKAAVAGLELGGGKSVIIGDRNIKNEPLLRAFGRHVHSLSGRYLVAEDMNTTCRDMEWIARETPYVTGLSAAHGGLGEPGPVTAYGVYQGIRASLKHVFGSPDVRGRSIAVQGLGNVGSGLLEHLCNNGARVMVSDIDQGRLSAAVEKYGVTVVAPEDYVSTECDVLSPCAIGAVVNERTIPMLRTKVIAGGANNILGVELDDAERLQEVGVAMAPDYVINAGGLIAMYAEWTRGTLERAMADTANIYETTLEIFSRASREKSTTMAASRALAEERIHAINNIRSHYSPPSQLHDGRHVR